MDDFTSALLARKKEGLKDVENSIIYTPFGIDAQESPELQESNCVSHDPSCIEPESVKQWRREFNAAIKKIDDNEAKNEQAMKECAAKELAEWMSWYKKNLVKVHAQNIAHEEELQAQRDKTTLISRSVSKVNPSEAVIWDHICQLCSLSVSTSCGDFSAFSRSTAGSSNKDVTRFRSLLLSLKNNPPKVCQ
uniref:Clathrin light chain n=1 Tax=Mesocestoides corti TaxID=53468 RepID=A0A5K3EK40_MESCO